MKKNVNTSQCKNQKELRGHIGIKTINKSAVKIFINQFAHGNQ